MSDGCRYSDSDISFLGLIVAVCFVTLVWFGRINRAEIIDAIESTCQPIAEAQAEVEGK